MNLMIVPGMFVCSSFLISVCMFIVSKALHISSDTAIVRAGRAIWLTLSLRNYFLGLTEFKYGIFNYVLVILLSFSYYFR